MSESLFASTKTDGNDRSFFTEIKLSDGRAIRLETFLDSGDRLYARIQFARQYAPFEKLVTTLDDGVHSYVQRGNRSAG